MPTAGRMNRNSVFQIPDTRVETTTARAGNPQPRVIAKVTATPAGAAERQQVADRAARRR